MAKTDAHNISQFVKTAGRVTQKYGRRLLALSSVSAKGRAWHPFVDHDCLKTYARVHSSVFSPDRPADRIAALDAIAAILETARAMPIADVLDV